MIALAKSCWHRGSIFRILEAIIQNQDSECNCWSYITGDLGQIKVRAFSQFGSKASQEKGKVLLLFSCHQKIGTK